MHNIMNKKKYLRKVNTNSPMNIKLLINEYEITLLRKHLEKSAYER